jgi:hypothetical protein
MENIRENVLRENVLDQHLMDIENLNVRVDGLAIDLQKRITPFSKFSIAPFLLINNVSQGIENVGNVFLELGNCRAEVAHLRAFVVHKERQQVIQRLGWMGDLAR